MCYLSQVACQTLLLPRTTSTRLQDKRAFSTIGIDNFRPLLVKNVYGNANNEIHKAWVTLYTCASTRNIILDLIPSLSANSLKNCLKRFIGRRRCPGNVISVNGSNLVAIETQEFSSCPMARGFFKKIGEKCQGVIEEIFTKL